MDIHRCRTIPFQPAAINALSFSPIVEAPGEGRKQEPVRLAVGRANGDIQIWNPAAGAWLHEKTLHGGSGRTIDELCWVQGVEEDEDEETARASGPIRLFSSGGSSQVTEWSLETGLPSRSYGTQSEVWCMAAQPAWKKHQLASFTNGDAAQRVGEYKGQDLVVGSADGTISLLTTEDGDLQLRRIIARPSKKKARVLGITWQNRHTVVAGFSDGLIRVYDSRNASLIRTMSLGFHPNGGSIPVWTVKCLPNGDIVSGDSTGEVRIFDGKTYSQLQRLKDHEADVLCLATSKDGKTIYSAGADRRTVVYELSKNKGFRGRWRPLLHRRFHDNDVKAIAIHESSRLDVVVSGGIDTNLSVLPHRERRTEHGRTVTSLPQSPPLISAKGRRLVASWWDTELRIWHVAKDAASSTPPRLISRLVLRGEENITSASMSDDGRLLAVASMMEIKVFQLLLRHTEAGPQLRLRKLEGPASPSKAGAGLVHFAPHSGWLAAVTPDNEVVISRVIEDVEKAEGIRLRLIDRWVELARAYSPTASQSKSPDSWRNFERMISRIAFSPQADQLVASDLSGRLFHWTLDGTKDPSAAETSTTRRASNVSDDEEAEGEDSHDQVSIYGQTWRISRSSRSLLNVGSAVLLLSFRQPSVPAEKNAVAELFVVTSHHHVYEFDVSSGKLTEWSRRNTTSQLPAEFRSIRDRVMGVFWDRKGRAWLYGSTWVLMLDVTQDLPLPSPPASVDLDEQENTLAIVDGVAKKRKRSQEVKHSQKHTTGAGSKIPEEEFIGLGKRMRKTIGGQAESDQWIDLDQRPQEDDSDDGDDTDDDAALLGKARRETVDGGENGTTHTDDAIGLVQQADKGKSWWLTYKYRPILGIVPLGHDEEEEEQDRDESQLEVCLVERPLWELDLPPKYGAFYERDT